MTRAIRAHGGDRAGDGDGCGGCRASVPPAYATASAAGKVLESSGVYPAETFYNWPGRCVQIRAFSGLAWKTHVSVATREIAKIRNCSESRPGRPGSPGRGRASGVIRGRASMRNAPIN